MVKVSFNIKQENWSKFCLLCSQQGLNASQALRNYVDMINSGHFMMVSSFFYENHINQGGGNGK